MDLLVFADIKPTRRERFVSEAGYLDRIRFTMRQLGLPDLDEALLEEFMFQFEGIMNRVNPLNNLDMPQEEPSQIFVNYGGKRFLNE